MNPVVAPRLNDMPSGYIGRKEAIIGRAMGARKRFAALKSNSILGQGGSFKRSLKWGAKNFIKQSYESFSKHYEKEELLGEGAYGQVYVCRHKASGVKRAVKILKVDDEEEAETVVREFSVLKSVDHPNLMKVYQLYEDKRNDTFYIVSDLYQGGELFDEIEEWGSLSEQDSAIIMNQVLSCINYFHSKGVVHRDLKPENILLADDDQHFDDIKIIDFGLAQRFSDYSRDKFHETVGSSYYMSPQVLQGKYGPKCDVWSAGVITFILLCGEAPYDGDDDDEIADAVLKGQFSFDDHPIWKSISDDAKDFVKWLLIYNEYERPTAEEALKHPWLASARKSSSLDFKKKDNTQAVNYLSNLKLFHADTKLKQVTCAFIASQLVMTQERDLLDEIFRELDQNCDGKLSRTELKYGIEEFLGLELKEDDLEEIFKRVNFSASGQIEYSEFVVASIELDDARLHATFSEFAKGDTVLTALDLKEALAMKKASDAMVRRMMNQIDPEHDGCISFEQFKASMLKTSAHPMSSSSIVKLDSSRSITSAEKRKSRRRSSGGRVVRRTSRVTLENHIQRQTSKNRITKQLPKGPAGEDRGSGDNNMNRVDNILQSLRAVLFRPKPIPPQKPKSPVGIKTSRKKGAPHALSVGYARRRQGTTAD